MDFKIGRLSLLTLVLLVSLLFYLDLRSDRRAADGDAAGQAVVSDGQLIAFQAYREGNGEVFLMDENGNGLVNVTNHDSLDYHPVGSPDGRWIAWVSNRSGSSQIWVAHRDGTDPRQATQWPSGAIDPSFSPDSRHIVFDAEDVNGNVDIYTIELATGNVANLSNHPAIDSHPFWSPDGLEIAFYSNRDNPASDSMDVYVMSSDGGQVRRLTTDVGDDRYPSWSPDGSRIAFSSTRTGDAEIWTMRSDDGSDKQRLTQSEGDDLAPAWSPDGNWIAFVSGRLGSFEVFRIRPDGTDEANLSNHETSDSNPRWVYPVE